MSTEQKPPPQPSPHHKEHIETTALGVTLLSSWEKFKQGKLISYKAMGIILIAITAIVVTIYIWSERIGLRSQLWIELESANSLTALEKFAEAHPDTTAGRIAELDRARVLLGPDGIERIPTARDQSERKRAIENVDKARELMTKLIDQFKDDPILKLECLVGMAKSEAALIGINKEGSISEFRGSVEKLIEWLDKIGEAADGTPWGDDAKKLSASLKSGSKVKDELINVQRSLYNVALMPAIHGGGPVAPGGFPPIGELPRLGNIPGLTGGPIAPVTPPITPVPTPKTPDPTPVPTPKIPDPKAPEAPKTPDPKSPPPKPPEPKPPEPPKK